jgi:carboxyl-terminal processing protease
MTKKSRIIAFCLVIATGVTVFAAYNKKSRVFDGNTRYVAMMQLMMQTLDEAHYQPIPLDDKLSQKTYDLYLKRLDYNKKFLIKTDIEKLDKYRNDIDDEIKNGSTEFFDLSYSILEERTKNAERYYKQILAKPFDFNKEESIETESKKLVFAADTNALKDEWRKYIKFQVLSRLAEMQETQDKAIAKNDSIKTQNKTTAKKDTVIKIKTYDEMEADARAKVLKSNNDFFKRLSEVDKNDRFSIFLNTITNTYDPHTEFFLPKDKETFDIALSGQLEGIGAQLQEKDGVIKITNIVVGSASWKQGKLKAGDIIQKVAQGSAEPVDIAGMRIDDAVRLIRGKKGTEVRLTVKKADGTTPIISIIRDIVILDETYAKSAIIKESDNVGYIKLPVFYSDFGKRGGHTCSEDVKNEIIKLKNENVKGIILDLRNNGGGSLQDVVDMTGLFIPKGPIVQVRNKTGEAKTLDDTDSSVLYDGPLVVLVNENSASASEILAAAIQDYKRGIIVGTNTFGKGTVQRSANLDDFINPSYSNLKPLGSLKYTMQKFYRVNGGSTQLKGVAPDIALPNPYEYIGQGEKDEDYPMAWDEIKPANYITWQQNSVGADNVKTIIPSRDVVMSKIKKSSAARVSVDPIFKLIEEEAKLVKKQNDNTSYSLKIATYKAEAKKRKEENKKYDGLDKEIKDFSAVNLQADLPALQADSAKATRNKEWLKNIKKDATLHEAALIIKDLK